MSPTRDAFGLYEEGAIDFWYKDTNFYCKLPPKVTVQIGSGSLLSIGNFGD
jgi:hypothetical protein